ncbi:MAG: hypothetical protein SGI92_28950 [Bryobacteraceae bacterium]|nr:hypothetical protein [Bryobacteraceae bacterium]
MNEFQREEELLRQGLRRREPRDGFANRVLARLDEPKRSAPVAQASWWSWIMAPAMAAVLIAVLGLGALQYQRVGRERQQRAKAEQALGQFARAMEITASKLELAQTRVFRTRGQQ